MTNFEEKTNARPVPQMEKKAAPVAPMQQKPSQQQGGNQQGGNQQGSGNGNSGKTGK